MKKLYGIVYEVKAVVAAEDSDEALDVARDFRTEIMCDATEPPLIVELATPYALPPGWDEHCIPFSSEDDRKISDYAAQPTPEDKEK